jgi:hypothetical protein
LRATDERFRMYDLRASQIPVATYGHNNLDPVYSLTVYGQERFVAGTARSEVRVYDFRLGSRTYSYADAFPCSSGAVTGLSRDNELQWKTGRVEATSFPSQLHNACNPRDFPIPTSASQDPCFNAASYAYPCHHRTLSSMSSEKRNPSLKASWNGEMVAENADDESPNNGSSDVRVPASQARKSCCYSYGKDERNKCEFHQKSADNSDVLLYFYGLPTSSHRRERSPIFSLASPSAISPILYVGASSTVYEVCIGEFDAKGLLSDPYFNDSHYTMQSNTIDDLSMYVMRGNQLQSYVQRSELPMRTVHRKAQTNRQQIYSDGSYLAEAQIHLRKDRGTLDRRWMPQ